MRKLGIKDAFSVARIIKAADIKQEIVTFANQISERKKLGEKLKVEDVGIEFFVTIITSVSSKEVENQFYELYADLKGVTPDEVSSYELGTVKADIKQLIETNDLKNFFQSASYLNSKM